MGCLGVCYRFTVTQCHFEHCSTAIQHACLPVLVAQPPLASSVAQLRSARPDRTGGPAPRMCKYDTPTLPRRPKAVYQIKIPLNRNPKSLQTFQNIEVSDYD